MVFAAIIVELQCRKRSTQSCSWITRVSLGWNRETWHRELMPPGEVANEGRASGQGVLGRGLEVGVPVLYYPHT